MLTVWKQTKALQLGRSSKQVNLVLESTASWTICFVSNPDLVATYRSVVQLRFLPLVSQKNICDETTELYMSNISSDCFYFSFIT